MKKILMGLTAVLALSFTVPAFAGEDAPKDDAKPVKAAKKGKKDKDAPKKDDAPAKDAK